MSRSLAAAALAASVALAPAAGGAVSFTSLIGFGDSLIDTGNLYAATGGATPQSPPYFQGRFSNGPIWFDRLGAQFESRGLPAVSFGFGAAAASFDTPLLPDLPEQLPLFALSPVAGALGAKPVAAVSGGSNDIFIATRLAGAAVAGGTPQSVAEAGIVQAGRAAAEAVLDFVVDANAQTGIADFVLFTVSDVAKTPRYLDPGAGYAPFGAAATMAADAFNQTLTASLADLRALGIGTTLIDAGGLFDDIVDDPAAFGFTDATTPCVSTVSPTPIPPGGVCADASGLVFWDPVHPTTELHALIAERVGASVEPVPLPAPALLLVAGLATLGAAGLRRR